MNLRRLLPAATCGLVLGLLRAPGAEAPPAPDPDTNVRFAGEAPPPAEPLSLWYRRPATDWVQALPLGNGRLGATVARALTAQAAGQEDAFRAALGDLETSLARGDDKTLPWDRRVSLAIALVEGKRFDLARQQVRQCLAGVNETRLRSLTTVSLYRLQVMSRAFGLAIEDPALRELARRLLPAGMRDRT